MFLILALALLSLGFPLDFEKIDSTVHSNTTTLVSPQISVSEPLITKQQQLIGLEKDPIKLQSAYTGKQLQNACSLSVGTDGDYNSVAAALLYTCGYSVQEIILIDSTHEESLVIDKNEEILIRGANSDGPYTQWNSQTTFLTAYLIEIWQGYLTLQYIDFVYVLTTDTIPMATPSNNFVSIRSQSYISTYITIEYCNFRGLGNEQGSQQTNSMIEIYEAYRVLVKDCSFSSANLVYAPIRAQGYFQFSVSNSNFTDINGGDTGAMEVIYGNGGQYNISIQGNIFDNCVGAKYGAISVIAINQDTVYSVSVRSNQIKNCAGSITGGIYFHYNIFGSLNLSSNTFIDNRRTSPIPNDRKQDAHIHKRGRQTKGFDYIDSLQYFQNAFAGSESTNPLSVFFEIDEDSDQRYFSLYPVSNKCWDASIDPEYIGYCICTAQGHPNVESYMYCICPDDDPNYQQDKCDFYLLPVCSSGSNPDYCRCSASNYPLDCLCPLDDLDTTYTQTLCLAERQYAQLPLCISDTTTPTGGCKCTSGNHPANCACPLNNDGQYTKDKCLYDILPRCTTDTTPASGCKCTSDNHPIDCTCPIDYPDYTYAQCQQDLQPVTPDKCSSITATTPEVDCACPTDAAKLELDPRKDTICKPSTGKEASGSIRAFLNMIVAIVLIPSLALIF
ncbi:MAG: hypothetical protein EZS28_011817 [Streblomastix strix]|uniref:Right handed beta helix domain-containing protein n=1 Tax=Streblomastix strix TaxID=222440 RepID=A0A5J4WD85_9EUKA|nr:MAG: hypothetical protein EZS28_011817 [Streblomastix strix]